MPFVLDHFFCNWSMVIPYHLCICKISNSIIFLHSVFKFQFSNCPTRSLFCKLFYQIFHTANPWPVSDWLTVSWWKGRLKLNFDNVPICCFFYERLTSWIAMSQYPVSSQAKDWMDQLFLCPGLFWKRVSPMVVIGRGKSATFFLCFGPSLAWWQTTERSTGWS